MVLHEGGGTRQDVIGFAFFQPFAAAGFVGQLRHQTRHVVSGDTRLLVFGLLEVTLGLGEKRVGIDAAFVDIGGVYGLFNFDAGTQGFKEFKVNEPEPASTATEDEFAKAFAKRHHQFSMMVATGQGRIALIQAGQFDEDDLFFKRF